MTRLRAWIRATAPALLLLAVWAAASQAGAAQPPDVRTVVPGSAAIWTDQTQYQIGQGIEYCYRIPIAGQITITDIAADGTARVIYAGSSAGTGGCQNGTVTPPAGNECLRLTYPLLGGSGQTQTCFQVVGTGPPPPPPGNVSIYTDRTRYRVGDLIRVCYSVPAPGPVTILDMLADGTTQTFLSGYDDGTGACQPGTVTPPAGIECMTLQYTYPNGRQTSTQACFEVIGQAPPPPSDWFNVGSALVDANGNWNYDQSIQLNTAYTFVRVTNGDCTAAPASNLVWESNLQRQPQSRVGVDVYAGELEPVGLAVSSGGSGHGRISRPVVLNPTTQVDLVLFSVGIVYNGTRLNVCFRTP